MVPFLLWYTQSKKGTICTAYTSLSWYPQSLHYLCRTQNVAKPCFLLCERNIVAAQNQQQQNMLYSHYWTSCWIQTSATKPQKPPVFAVVVWLSYGTCVQPTIMVIINLVLLCINYHDTISTIGVSILSHNPKNYSGRQCSFIHTFVLRYGHDILCIVTYIHCDRGLYCLYMSVSTM